MSKSTIKRKRRGKTINRSGSNNGTDINLSNNDCSSPTSGKSHTLGNQIVDNRPGTTTHIYRSGATSNMQGLRVIVKPPQIFNRTMSSGMGTGTGIT